MANKAKIVVSHATPPSRMAAAADDLATELRELRERQQRLEIQLHENAAKLKHYVDLFEQTPVAHFVLARDGTIVQSNGQGARLLGLPDRTPYPRRFDTGVEAESRPVLEAFLQRTFSGQTAETSEVALLAMPQRPRRILHLAAVADTAGSTCNLVAIDITERKTTAAAAQAKLDLLTDLSAHIPGILFQYQLDPDGSTHFPYVSESIHRMYGVTSEQAGTDAASLKAHVLPEDSAGLEASMHLSADTLAPWRHEYRMVLPGGEVIWRGLDAHPERLANGSVLWHGYTIDISKRKRIEEALRQSEERWKLALEGARDAVWDWDVTRDRFTYSARWQEMLGYAEDEVVDLAEESRRRVHPDDVPITRANRQTLLEGVKTISSIELRIRCNDGSWKWIHSRGMVVSRDARGKPLRIVGTNSDITERKQMEEALRESEERWKFALEGAGEGVWDLNAQTGSIMLSPSWKAMLGYTDEEIRNLPGAWSGLIHPDDLPLAAEVRTMLQEGEKETSSVELRMRCKDGSWKWILTRGKVVSHDEQGRPLRIVGTNSDITERRQMEESLRESEERWKLALEGAGHGVWDWDLDSNKALFSKRWKDILGYAEHEIGTDASEWMSRTHPDDQAVIAESHRAIVAQEKNSDSIEFRMRCKDGSWKWMLGSGILTTRNDKGKTMRMVGTLSDISERKRVEEALRVSEERWKFALEGAGDGVWDWDVPRGEITFSRRAKEILGHADVELPRNYDDWCSRIHPDDMSRSVRNREQLMNHEKDSSSNEVRVRCNDGSWKWLLSRGMVVRRDENGRPLRLVGTISDITQRKQIEEELRLTLLELEDRRREAEKHAEAKSRFLNAASHDLRQPLYATRLFADALADGKLTAQQRDILANLQLSVKAMSAQLEMLLDVSRFDMGKFEPQLRDIPLTSICHDLEATYAPIASKAGVLLRLLPGSGVVHTDPVLIGRLLGNLIDNAIKFSRLGTILVCARRSAQDIRIEVRDNGPGIAPEHHQQIFDEYYQIDNPARNPSAGLGLGLSIAQRIARLLDVPLTLRTRVGQGTVFAVTLPAAAKPERVAGQS